MKFPGPALAAGLLTVALAGAVCAAEQNRPGGAGDTGARFQTRPNIILIVADDLGFADLGCYGSPISTPNLDALASGGMRFTQFYNAARCCPSRASLLTGLYPNQAGIGHMLGRSANGLYNGDLSKNALTLAEALKNAGYATYMAGKWHLTPWRPGTPGLSENSPTGRGFDRFYGIIQSIRSFYDPPSLMEDARALPATQGDYHFTDAVSEHAVQYIRGHKPDAPYFLYAAYAAPHFPLHARESDIAKYRGKFRAGWDVLRKERYQRLLDLKLIDPAWPLPERDPQELSWDDVKPDYRGWFDERMAVYAAMVEQMDRGIGEIMSAVKARGELEKTLVVFLSDNGGCAEEIDGTGGLGQGFPRQTRSGKRVRLGNDPAINPGPEDTYGSYGLEWAGLSNTPFRRYKSFVHEGGITTPMIVSWPSKVSPGITHAQGHVIDLMPTFLEVASAAYPAEHRGRAIQPLEGRSLLPLFDGRERPIVVYAWEHEGNRAIRQGDWKLVSRFPRGWELYDMKQDRLETRDLAAEMPERVVSLAALYALWAQRVGVKAWTGAQTPIGWADLGKYKK